LNHSITNIEVARQCAGEQHSPQQLFCVASSRLGQDGFDLKSYETRAL